MKEATGELNMTVITVVAIAGIAALLYAFVWPALQTNIINSTNCANAITCTDCDGSTCSCTYLDDDGTVVEDPITCPDQTTDNSATN